MGDSKCFDQQSPWGSFWFIENEKVKSLLKGGIKLLQNLGSTHFHDKQKVLNCLRNAFSLVNKYELPIDELKLENDGSDDSEGKYTNDSRVELTTKKAIELACQLDTVVIPPPQVYFPSMIFSSPCSDSG
eukprot:Pgem_evm2s3869